MRLFRRMLPLLIMLLSVAGCQRTPIDPAMLDTLPEVVDYNFHIRPILSDRCYACHGPDENTREAGLRLDTEDGPYAPLESDNGSQAIVPGKAHKSELIRRILSDDPDEQMPPPASNLALTDYEIALLQRWVEQGAAWKPHWAFIPPKKPEPPATQYEGLAQNAIDHFVLARLEREGLPPAPPAPKEQLLRRLTFDLTGLPPTLEEIDTFLADHSENAYENAVDRLLASKAYGERMTSIWLDVARYADTGGYQSDRLRRMWPWRDWVIEAFNENLPYDDFVTWQLAGDLLPEATQTQRLATAFNRNHRQTEEGGSIEEEFRMEYVADRTNTTGTAFLGLTMECARCHDHKYDPISQKEYYEMFAFFNNIDESGQTSYFTDAVPVPTLLLGEEKERNQLDEIRSLIAEKEQELAGHIEQQSARFNTWIDGLDLAAIPQTPPGLKTHIPFDRIENESTPNLANPQQPGHTVFDPITTPGQKGNAVQFDGENGLEFKDVGVFERTDAFSLSFWMKAAEWNDWNALVHRTRATYDAGSRGYEVSLQGDKLVAGLAHMWPENALRIITTQSLPLDTWIHVTMTYDGSSKASGLKLFVDGKEAAVEVVKDNLFRNITYERVDVNLTTGYRFRDRGFKDGLLDELKIHDRALTTLEVAQLSGNDQIPALRQKSAAAFTPQERAALVEYYLAFHDETYASLQKQLRALRETEDALIAPIEEIMVMREMEDRRPTHILVRGVYNNKGDEVDPATPAALPEFDASLPPNRLGLARWLTDTNHPLTARVAVNRYWQMFFDQGIVATPEDFGSQGALPSHPMLLDWLAVEFIESGWDVKALLKTIVMSATYRQHSEAPASVLQSDPANVLLARGPRRRLTAEMIRDNALAASGLLVDKTGGPPVKPYQPAGLWKEKSGKVYERDTGEGLYRRSLYTFWRRTSPPPAMITFDATRRNQCVVRRQQTSTPMQALVLLNDPQFVEASRILAEKLITRHDALATRIEAAFRLLTSRMPTAAETEVLTQTYNDQYVEFADHPADALALLDTGDAPWNTALNPQELAATSILVNTIMNFDAAIINR